MHLNDRTFAYTARELISDLSGNLVGYLKVRGVYTVSTNPRTSTPALPSPSSSMSTATCSSPSSVTNTGQRIQLELP